LSLNSKKGFKSNLSNITYQKYLEMKVLITAVSGQLGKAVTKRAIEEFGAENVFGTARTPEKANHLGIKVFKGDYDSKDDFDFALKGVDAVLLISSMGAPENRIGQHRNVINAAKEAGMKKIVYTSIIGNPGDTTFDAVVNSNRQTEEDIKNSGLNYAIGRNGLYLEPDIEFLDHYVKEGKIENCAGDGKCSYTTRDELAIAYVQMLKNDGLNGKVYNLVGEAITQTELVGCFNKYFNTELIFSSISPEEYQDWQLKHN
jgi:NAD(P)H dehydrogenase (quinone)